jgi:hypothetical protein
MKFDAQRFSRLDWAIVGGAGVVFISGFLPWWGYSGPLTLYSASVAGWSAGFTAWAGILLLAAAGAYHFLRRAEVSLPTAPVGPAVLTAGVGGLGLLLVVIRWLTLPRVHGGLAGSIGAKYGIWLAIVAGVVEVGAAVVAVRASGEPLPWAQAQPAEPLAGESTPTEG